MSEDATGRLAHHTRRLGELIAERVKLWDDEGGRTTLRNYLRPHAEAAEDLVAALRERDALIAAFEEEMAIVERELEAVTTAHAQTDEAVARATEDLRSADEHLAEVRQGVADATKLEGRAVRFADLANAYPGDREFELAQEQRRVELNHLQKSYPTLGVRHILEGEINAAGKFTGCHSRRSVVGMILTWEAPDANGVYYATVAGWGGTGKPVDKDVPAHTMFPDDWSENHTCRKILEAYKGPNPAELPNGTPWSGRTKNGIVIMGHLRHGRIIGYPKRRKSSNED